ncbi:hypothetical protein [Lacipirellula sp.]|uniref:hypothetical protein n=1 Tax=Lacipirellula sp. TaxID=2691419 RepID=UPI003D09CBD1
MALVTSVLHMLSMQHFRLASTRFRTSEMRPLLTHRAGGSPTGTGFTVRKFEKLILNGKFWPSVEPEKALMPIGKLADGRYYIEGKLLTPIEAETYLEQLRSRLHAVGVRLAVMFMDPRGDGYRPTLVQNFESL